MAVHRHSVPPPAWFILALAAQQLIAGRRRVTVGSVVWSALLACAAGALAVRALVQFRRNGTTVDPEHPERVAVLVTDGPFAITRNPMYVALTCALVAHSVLRRSPLSLAPAAGFALVLHAVQIPAEERALSSRFGPEYERYRAAVPRWVGWRAAA